MFALTLPKRIPNFCSAIRATLGQRQICQSPGLALNAHSGNGWGKIPVLTGPSPSVGHLPPRTTPQARTKISFKEFIKRAGQIPWKRADFRWETVRPIILSHYYIRTQVSE